MGWRARKHVLALVDAGLIEVTIGQARDIRLAGMRARERDSLPWS
jgi:hypothetical protein